MGSDDLEFGPDTERIRAWMAKRATYADAQAGASTAKHRDGAPPPSAAPLPPRTVPDGREAGRSILAALHTPPTTDAAPSASGPSASGPTDAAPATTAPTATHTARQARRHHDAAPQRSPVPSDHATEVAQEATRGPAETPAPTTAGRSTNVVFSPRSGVRRAMSAILLLVMAATVVAGVQAVRETSTLTIGVAAIALLVTLVVWAVRAGTTVTELAVIRGHLEIIRDGGFEVIDLASPFTPVAVIGAAGQRRWRVLIERPGQPLFEVDRTMVDPHRFTEVLHRLRPDLRPDDTGQTTSIQ